MSNPNYSDEVRLVDKIIKIADTESFEHEAEAFQFWNAGRSLLVDKKYVFPPSLDAEARSFFEQSNTMMIADKERAQVAYLRAWLNLYGHLEIHAGRGLPLHVFFSF